MAKSTQNSKQHALMGLDEGPSPWSWRPIWVGVVVAVFTICAAIHGTRVTQEERGRQVALDVGQEGLALLRIERDVSRAAFDYMGSISMAYFTGDVGARLGTDREAFRASVADAAERLAASPPSPSWETIHEDMSDATAGVLETFDEPRTLVQTRAWMLEFLFDFKRVVPTDNQGSWSDLLEAATWAQEVPNVLQDYLDVAMARVWTGEGRQPNDADAIRELSASLSEMDRLRESHGGTARSYSFFEEYILPEVAEDAGPRVAALVESLETHPAVVQMNEDTPFLLGLEDAHRFESIERLDADLRTWGPELAGLADTLLGHATARMDRALVDSRRRGRLGLALVVLAVVTSTLFALRFIRRRMRVDARIRHALERDPLTALANRYALFSVAPERLGSPELASFALIHLDLDDFKSINDDHGHHIGDEALIAFADALRASVRSASDLVCRIGGDEFVILLHQLRDPVAEVDAVVQRLRDDLAEPIVLDGIPMELHFTAGVAVSRGPASLEDLMVEADLALIEAKERGRDVAQFYRRKLGRRMIHELSLALGSGELRCAFQPQVDMETGAIVGLEALARWHRQDRMQVPTRSLIEALDWLGASRDWLKVAMRDIERAWRIAGGRLQGRIWVNLMGSDLEENAPEQLLEVFSGVDVPLERLGVEVTDPVVRSRLHETGETLQALRAAGLGVALDDVGDDRVPLLHVTELPIDLVKLDRCVVQGIDSQAPLRAVVESLADLCSRLDRRILAEGVETPEEEQVLRRLGIRYVQGFLFARPLPLEALGPFFDENAGGAAGAHVA